jgi:hypothetical protein
MQAEITASNTNPETAVWDEVKMYVDARYVSASEAYWRIYGFSLHNESPAVEQLAVHLENQQEVYVRENITMEEARAAAQRQSRTTITEWFKCNCEDADARCIKYHNFPEHYTWSKERKVWARRRNRTISIGRIYFVIPRDERYYLRLLLLHRSGLLPFEDA